MSEEHFLAEVVRASELKPGDRFAFIGSSITADAVTMMRELQSVRVDFCHDGDSRHACWSETAYVARILPDPVDVQEFWRVRWTSKYMENHKCFDFEQDAKTYAYDAVQVELSNVRIEHVRETILSREEVQS